MFYEIKKNIFHLYIDEIGHDRIAWEHIFFAIADSKVPSLRVHASVSLSINRLLQGLAQYTQIRCLVLEVNYPKKEELTALKDNHHLTTLIIYTEDPSVYQTLEAPSLKLIKIAASNRIKKIKVPRSLNYLDLEHCSITPQALVEMLDQTKLQYLSIKAEAALFECFYKAVYPLKCLSITGDVFRKNFNTIEGPKRIRINHQYSNIQQRQLRLIASAHLLFEKSV